MGQSVHIAELYERLKTDENYKNKEDCTYFFIDFIVSAFKIRKVCSAFIRKG